MREDLTYGKDEIYKEAVPEIIEMTNILTKGNRKIIDIEEEFEFT
jgi:hypothetical protein